MTDTQSLEMAAEAETTENGPGEIARKYRRRLLGFIRPRVRSEEDAEDIVQDVFYELTEALSMMQPIEKVTAWMFRVARNRITDLYRKKKPIPFSSLLGEEDDDEQDDSFPELEALLADDDDNPETRQLRALVWTELELALAELPAEQREVFVWHELEGLPYEEIAARTGAGLNTLLSRKRYAVLHLRRRLRGLYDDLVNY